MNDQMREEFEEWAVSEGYVRDCMISGHYIHASTSAAWHAWQASRASIVVDLPKTDLTGAIGIAHKAITKRCAEAITKTGVRVK